MKGLDDKKIEEYLEKHGITSMQDNGLKKTVSATVNYWFCIRSPVIFAEGIWKDNSNEELDSTHLFNIHFTPILW